MKISAQYTYHIQKSIMRGLKIIAMSLLLTVPSVELQAQSDTCFVSIDITKKDAFALINGSKGEIKIENGNQVLVTPCQILKVVNQSTGIALDKNDGRFRIINFESGAATTYDYTRAQSATGELEFKAVKTSNMRGFIYFLLPNREADLKFRLENDANTEHHLVTRPTPTEPVAETSSADASSTDVAPADKKPVDANDLQNASTKRENPAVGDTQEVTVSEDSPSGSWWPWIIAFLSVAGAIAYSFYLRRKQEKAIWNDPIDGGDENILPLEQRVMVKQVRDLQQRLQASIASDRDHSLRLEHSEKDRKEAISRAAKAEEDFLARAAKAEEDFKNRAEKAEKDFNKRAEQAEKVADDRAYGAEQQANARTAAAQQKAEQEITAALQKAEQEVNLARKNAEQQITSAQQKAEQEITAAQQNAELQITAAQQKAEQEITAAQQNAELQITAARQLAEEQINLALEDKVKGIEEAREEAYLRATREYNVQVDTIRAEAKEITETAQQVAHEAITNKQAAIDEACQPLLNQISQLEAEKTALQETTSQALTDMEAELRQAIAEKESTISALAAEKDQAIASAEAEKAAAISALAAEKNQAIASAEAEKAAAISALAAEKDQAIATAEAEKAAAISALAAEKDQAIASAEAEKAAAISALAAEKDQAISAAQERLSALAAEKDQAIAEATASMQAAISQAQKEKEESISLYRNNFREERLNDRNHFVARINVLLQRVSEQMVLMKEGIETLGTDNNYSNTTMHMARKEADFVCWFEKNILEAGEDGPESVADVRQMMQDQIMVLLSGNYSWLTELIRFKAYAGISADFQREFKRAGIPVEAIRSAHTAIEAILGMLNISIVVPQLFAEEFNIELHRNCNAPIVNSFYPKGFDERRQQLRGIICDVLRVGVELDGQSVQAPEVSTF